MKPQRHRQKKKNKLDVKEITTLKTIHPIPGTVNKLDVKKAALMRERKKPEYAVILAFDIKIDGDAEKEAQRQGVTIFNADIIYRLLDKYAAFTKEIEDAKKRELTNEAIFPCVLKIQQNGVYRKKPLVRRNLIRTRSQ
jgi:translation initiation factor IF-2